MKKYELLKQYQMEAAKLQLEKEQAMQTVKELCEEWNITLSNKEEQIINNTITINKGRIIAVENNELQEAYDVLAENFNNRCKRIADLQAQYDKLDQEYTDFQAEMEAEYVAAINKRDEQIAELKDELEIKDALIENLKARLRVAEEEKQHKETTRYNHIEVVDDPLYNEVEEESDAMPQFNIPEEYKDNQEIKEVVEIQTEKWLNARAVGPFTKEEMQEKCIAAANMTIETIIAEQKKAKEYNIRYTKIHNEKNQTVVAVKGEITLGGKPYVFKYGATHKMPCIYGCMSMELIEEAKEALDKAIHMIKDETEQKHAYEVVYAFDKGFVAWQQDDGVFKGYTRDYAFVWDGTSAVPCGATVKNALNEMKPYRKMNASWGNGFVQRANDIMAFCRTIDKKTKSTKEEIPQVTEEESINVTNEIDELDI